MIYKEAFGTVCDKLTRKVSISRLVLESYGIQTLKLFFENLGKVKEFFWNC